MRTTEMNFEQTRFNMIEQQIRPWDVLDQVVLSLLGSVKREDFVPEIYRELSFGDFSIPLGYGSSMLEPKIEARMLQSIMLSPTDNVLEIGTGSGFMAALLASLAMRVTTIEIVPELAEMARHNLAKKPFTNVEVIQGDGYLGWESKAPYNVIMVSGAVSSIPPELIRQLAPNGRMVVVVGCLPIMTTQLIIKTDKDVFSITNLFETVIPSLVSKNPINYFDF